MYNIYVCVYEYKKKRKNRRQGQFECDMTQFCCFNFVCSHIRCGCSIVCLRFQVVQRRD